jgi:hypothetical protein
MVRPAVPSNTTPAFWPGVAGESVTGGPPIEGAHCGERAALRAHEAQRLTPGFVVDGADDNPDGRGRSR